MDILRTNFHRLFIQLLFWTILTVTVIIFESCEKSKINPKHLDGIWNAVSGSVHTVANDMDEQGNNTSYNCISTFYNGGHRKECDGKKSLNSDLNWSFQLIINRKDRKYEIHRLDDLDPSYGSASSISVYTKDSSNNFIYFGKLKESFVVQSYVDEFGDYVITGDIQDSIKKNSQLALRRELLSSGYYRKYEYRDEEEKTLDIEGLYKTDLYSNYVPLTFVEDMNRTRLGRMPTSQIINFNFNEKEELELSFGYSRPNFQVENNWTLLKK